MAAPTHAHHPYGGWPNVKMPSSFLLNLYFEPNHAKLCEVTQDIIL